MFRTVFAAVVAWFVVSVTPALADPPPLEAYGKLPNVERAALSPSGKRLAFVGVAAEKRRLVVLDIPRKPIFAAEVGDAKVRDIAWAGERFLVVTFGKTTNIDIEYGGDKWELHTVLVADLETHETKWVFGTRTSPHAAIMGSYGLRQVKGRWFGYFGGIQSEGAPVSLFRVDLEKNIESGMADSAEFRDTDWVIGSAGDVVARTDYSSDTGDWRLVSMEKPSRVLIHTKSPLRDINVTGLGRTPDTVVVSRGLEDGTSVLEEGSLVKAGDPVRIGDETTAGEYRDSNGLLIGLAKHDGSATFYDPKLDARFRGARKAFPGLHAELVSYSDDFGTMIFHTDAGDDSGTLWLVDVASGRADPISADRAAIQPADVGPTRMFAYKAADGLAMEGVLTLPPGREAKGLPVVVMPHGGPIVEGDKPAFDYWAQAFASRGYAVLQPNYRGSDGYGADFRNAALGEWGGRMQTDVSDGLAALAAQGIVDPKRACIVGASYGGYAALAGVTIQHGIYRCAVSVSGVTDLKSFVSWSGDHYGRGGEVVRWWRHLMGVKSTSDPVLRQLSPALQADKADAPVLLIHGVDDTTVPISQSQEMERELKRAGKPVEFVTLKGEDHYMSKEETRLEMLKASVEFVLKQNPPN
jgi:dipeptidyl aminopeptidase/acylaminoacyl peptidase